MKRNLIVLTGIVFVISILIAVGCQQPKQTDSTEGETELTFGYINPSLLASDSTVEISLKDTLIDGRYHIFMYDSNDSTIQVVDNLYTDVEPGWTVYWINAPGSNIKEILNIRPVLENGVLFTEEAEEIELFDKKLYKYKVPDEITPPVTEKYEIVFTVKIQEGEEEKESTWCIDPYLRIED